MSSQVVLFVKPLEDGQAVLRGVAVEVLSVVTICKVDKWGRGVDLGWVLALVVLVLVLRCTVLLLGVGAGVGGVLVSVLVVLGC